MWNPVFHLLEALFLHTGLMTKEEQAIMEGLMQKQRKLYYIPLLWASILVSKARNDKLITEYDWKSIVDMIVEYRTKLSHSLFIELVNIPLVYSQVRPQATDMNLGKAYCLGSRAPALDL